MHSDAETEPKNVSAKKKRRRSSIKRHGRRSIVSLGSIQHARTENDEKKADLEEPQVNILGKGIDGNKHLKGFCAPKFLYLAIVHIWLLYLCSQTWP